MCLLIMFISMCLCNHVKLSEVRFNKKKNNYVPNVSL